MKLTSLPILFALLIACGCDAPRPKIIKTKWFIDKDCICQFEYASNSFDYNTFQDSCSLYSVGDTIK